MVLASLDRRLATAIRLLGLVLISLSILGASRHPPGTTGRGLVVSVLFAAVVGGWLVWTARPERQAVTPEIYAMAAGGGWLVNASPQGAASAFVFVAVVVAGVRMELPRAAPVALVGAGAVAGSDLVYGGRALGLLAYALGFAASLLAASHARQRVRRVEQAELLLAQTQRSHEEQLRAARLEESTRIAREIHDVLAHTLAGLAIQLEATAALLEQDADRDVVLARVNRAHQLTREGLHEARRAVGALRGEGRPVPEGIEALVADYRAGVAAEAELTLDGDLARLTGPTGETVLRIVREALTNVRKHAPGAAVSVTVHAGEEEVVTLVDDRPRAAEVDDRPDLARARDVATTVGGYGLQGMRERAELLGGALRAGPHDAGWRVELRLPAPDRPRARSRPLAAERSTGATRAPATGFGGNSR